MAENTKIEWATHTLNWWTGCEAISPACAHCYAAAWAKRAGRDFAERRLTTEANRRQALKWERNAAEFEREHGHRQRIFVNSLADVFDNQVPQEWRESLFAMIRQTPSLDYLLLTKRIGNAKKMLPADWGDGYPNVWIGSTVVTQEEAERDIPKLLAVPARIHFLSIEPMLGPLDLMRAGALRTIWWDTTVPGGRAPVPKSVDWIIAGGESGSKARPTHPQWARSLRDQCAAGRVSFFWKQWGAFLPSDQPEARRFNYDENRCHDWGDGIDSIRLHKKDAGRLLDGIEHNDSPRPAR